MSITVAVDASVGGIVAPASLTCPAVRVMAHDARLDSPLEAAAERLRTTAEAGEITSAVRTMYKRVGLDPTKHRPSSEALLRRIRKGDPLPRVNSLVDVINWCSVESQLPFGLYDTTHIVGSVVLRLGKAGESYAGIRKDDVHVEGRLVLADDEGPFGNPSSDSDRTKVTEGTTQALVVIFAPAGIDEAVAELALLRTRQRVQAFCVS